jgi:trans-aconitate methyltransferase
MNWTAYQNYWDAHWRHVGPDTFVTDMPPVVYDAYLEELFSNYQKREVNTIFDLGCGTGGMVPTALKLWPGAQYTGLDICKEAIDYCKQKYPQLTWVVMDKPALPGYADLIICHSVFTHISEEDTRKYLEIIRGSLNLGGRASLSIHTDSPDGPRGNIGRVDYNHAYFESLLSMNGFRILSMTDMRQRYYEVEAC